MKLKEILSRLREEPPERIRKKVLRLLDPYLDPPPMTDEEMDAELERIGEEFCRMYRYLMLRKKCDTKIFRYLWLVLTPEFNTDLSFTERDAETEELSEVRGTPEWEKLRWKARKTRI